MSSVNGKMAIVRDKLSWFNVVYAVDTILPPKQKCLKTLLKIHPIGSTENKHIN